MAASARISKLCGVSGFLPDQVPTAARMNSLWMVLNLDDLVENIVGQQPGVFPTHWKVRHESIQIMITKPSFVPIQQQSSNLDEILNEDGKREVM
jgi:hypothetical protein